MLVPVIGIIQTGTFAYADRYTYLPQIGVCFAGTWAAADWTAQWRHRRAALGSVAAAILAVLAIVSFHQTSYWRNSITLWTHTLACTEDNAFAHNTLGNALLKEGRTEEAMAHYREAFRIDPAYAQAHYSLGIALLQQGRTEEAIAQYREALQLDPAYAEAHNNLGNALLQQGEPEEAIAEYREALRINPASAEAQNNLGFALLEQGLTEEAIADFREALRINPANLEARYNLGAALLEQGHPEEAIAQYRESLRIDPVSAEAHYNLGSTLFQQGRADEGIFQTQKAVELEPSNLSYENNLAWMLATAPQASLRDGARALELAGKANQSTGGNNPQILRTLAAAYAETGEFANALQTAQKALQLAEAQSNTGLAATLRREIKLYEGGHRFEEPQ
jgi:tetratricopeptide (TPR) repeat protein